MRGSGRKSELHEPHLHKMARNGVTVGGKPKLSSVRLYIEQVGIPNCNLLEEGKRTWLNTKAR